MDKIKITKDESINCVKTSTWKLMWTDYRKWSIFVLLIFLFLLSFFVVIIYLISLLPNLNILYFLFSSFVLLTISFVFPITYYTLLKEKVQKKFMMEFANANNFSHKEYDLSRDSIRGGLFKYGEFLRITNIIDRNRVV